MDKKKKKGLSVLTKIILMCSLPMIILSVIITVYAVEVLISGLQSEAIKSLSYLCQSVSASYDALDPGDYHMEGDELYKGDFSVSGNVDIIDSYTEGYDVDITLFYGDTRRATSLLDSQSGERIIGTTASDTVVDKVINKGENYTSTSITINNENYYAYYQPLKNSNGQIVGMIFAGEPSEDIDKTISQRRLSIIGISLFILFISIGICSVLIRGIVSIITHAGGMIDGIANGDLRIQLSDRAAKLSEKAKVRDDEVGVMINSMYDLVDKLQGTIRRIKDTTENLLQAGDSLEGMANQTSNTTDEISRAIEEVSKGAVIQAEEIESATMQVATIGNMIESIVVSVKELDEVSRNMKQADDESELIIDELGRSNDRTIEAIKKIDASVHTTNDSVGKIQEAVNLITSIASETSLLALNASIEAARAGEAGRGFAVVASQISKLSEDSNNSAKTIEDIINQLSVDSEASVQIMAEVSDIIAEQQSKLNETRTKFGDVSKGIDSSMVESKNIYDQIQECDSARVKVTEVIENLSAVSEENAASTQQTNSSMQELNYTVNQLADAAKDLKNIADALGADISFFTV